MQDNQERQEVLKEEFFSDLSCTNKKIKDFDRDSKDRKFTTNIVGEAYAAPRKSLKESDNCLSG